MEERICRICGCTEDNACEGGCSWVEEDLCSSCADKKEPEESEDGEDEDGEEATAQDELSPVKEEKVSVKPARYEGTSAVEKLEFEHVQFKKGFKNSGKEAMVSKHVLEALTSFCQNSDFANAVLLKEKTITDCLIEVMKGVGSAISDLEVYQRAANFYFPGSKISFAMIINTDGRTVSVPSKESKPVEVKKISINLDELL